jgi:branched-subunit amino acid ABC-type transport system permease component
VRFSPQVNLIEEPNMRAIVKLLIAVGFATALAGCVVAPVGPPRAYVGAAVVAPAPVVVVGGGYWHRW